MFVLRGNECAGFNSGLFGFSETKNFKKEVDSLDYICKINGLSRALSLASLLVKDFGLYAL